MENISEKICKQYSINDNEKIILEYLLKHTNELKNLTTRDIAAGTYTNAMMVIRLTRKLGFESYKDFQYEFIDFIDHYKQSSIEFHKEEDYSEIIDKSLKLETTVIKETSQLLKKSKLKEVIEALKLTEYIDIFAYDANSTIASYASHNFYKAGKITTVYRSVDKQLLHCTHIPENHVVIFLTKSSYHSYINDILCELKKRNITIILITGKNNKKYTNLSTYTLLTPFDQYDLPAGELTYHIGTRYIFDLLYLSLFSYNYDQSKDLEHLQDQMYRKSMK